MLVTQRAAVEESFRRYTDNLNRETGLYGTDTGHHLFNMVAGGHVPTKITTFAMRAGGGKGQPMYSKIYTPDGYKLMGQIAVGDEVLNESGGVSRVMGVFPQGKQKTYRIHFTDGATVDCDENHLWKVYTARDRKAVTDSGRSETTTISTDRHTVVDVKGLIGNERTRLSISKPSVLNFKLPVTRAVQFDKRTLDIPPYAMGALIGDGCFSKGQICNPNNSLVDRVIVEMGGRRGAEDRVSVGIIGCNFHSRIRAYFGECRLSYDKFIPSDYLFSSIEDRLELLRGLMDTDGYVNAAGTTVEFYTSSPRLAKDIQFLVRSLGGVGILNNRGKKTYVHNKVKKLSKYDSYSVVVNMPSGINPFFIPEKAMRVRAKSKYETPRYIDWIEYLGEMETQCIKVDNPTSLYITDDFVVTHNTSTIIPMVKAAGRIVNDRRSELLVGSWEMQSSYLIDRYVCHEVGIPIAALRYPKTLPVPLQQRVMKAYTEGAKLPVHYHQNSTDINKLIPVLKKFIEDTKAKERVEGIKIQPVFALDFIGRIKGASRYGSKTYDIEDFLQGIKEFANDYGLAVYILAQLLRSADEREMPELMDVKDSATIEDNSDTLILGHRPEYYRKETVKDPRGGEVPSKNRILMRVMKAREAAPGDFLENCNMEYFRMWHRDDEWNTDYWKKYNDINFWNQQFI